MNQNNSIVYPKWFGGSASCMAVVVSHPLDLIKVRMQMESKTTRTGTLSTGLRIIRAEGVLGLYSGVSAGLTRQLTYGSVRIGLYESLKDYTTKHNIPASPPILGLLAGLSGFVGAIFGNPSDIGNIRMQNDGSLPPHARRNYAHIFDAWKQIYTQEGWKAFSQGLWPNAFRCAMMTSCQLASYDSLKGVLMRVSGLGGDHAGVHVSASLLAALVATTVCSPVDVVKTQLMGASGKEGIVGVVRALMAGEGARWIFRGWTPSFVRLGPQTMATLILLEQHKKIYRSMGVGVPYGMSM
ncbi:hypothetical protein ASPWEDRAFT_63355 [Aspergillus wentii DTO 134E9]|uniref:Mitochondrial thiamine pyrophosphate carrier 1 n=1 Tax=Aspergillus wentii DTO 134E9 TaxID=1073089 RepID=A0A1L9R4S4_ASPWE|nr:uncharacterized protein ASPWEDRAFT_63355 [Aspergillus wentii DTO 134E9]OJJ29908.1 hypothetical protein ASPWEDRAFT_63355 [Aspergillus wentii DTO 134E9]